MTVIAVGTVCGSAGASTLALDIARRCGEGSLLIEVDPDGGSLAARLDLTIRPGLTELAGAARMGIEFDDVWRYAQASSCGVAVVVAHPAAEQTSAALRAAARHICDAIASPDATLTVVLDVGRLRPGSPALGVASCADYTIIVSHNSVEAVVSLSHRNQLLSSCPRPVVVLNQSRPYSIADVAAASGQQVWGVVPHARTRREQRQRQHAVGELVSAMIPNEPGDSAHGIGTVSSGRPLGRSVSQAAVQPAIVHGANA